MLRDANLVDVHLMNARLDGADFRGAITSEPALYPTGNLWPSDNLFPGSGLPDAISNDATTFQGAKYDDLTQWPKAINNPEEQGAIMVENP
jgi:uncharacterized protein YjbI with pentapeptide repeats